VRIPSGEGELRLKLQMDSLTEKTGFPVKSFFDLKEAETWLDKKQHKLCTTHGDVTQ
jgi:hypothetical protein